MANVFPNTIRELTEAILECDRQIEEAVKRRMNLRLQLRKVEKIGTTFADPRALKPLPTSVRPVLGTVETRKEW